MCAVRPLRDHEGLNSMNKDISISSGYKLIHGTCAALLLYLLVYLAWHSEGPHILNIPLPNLPHALSALIPMVFVFSVVLTCILKFRSMITIR